MRTPAYFFMPEVKNFFVGMACRLCRGATYVKRVGPGFGRDPTAFRCLCP